MRTGASMMARDFASQALGMTIERMGPGEAVLSMRVRDDMINGHGTCHGGMIFSLADSAFAFACNSYNLTTVAASAQISFVRAARAGDHLTATCHEQFREGRNGIYDTTVRDQNGELIALFRGKSLSLKGEVIRAGAPSS